MEKDLKRFLNTFPTNYNIYFDGESIYTPKIYDPTIKFDIFLRIMSDPISRIFSAKKQFELRKYIPKHTGLVFLYETEKVQAITGCFYFQNYHVKPIKELWETVGERATKKEKFDAYFEGKEFGVALEIKDFQKFKNPISQEILYLKFPNLPKPPQPYVYLYSEVNTELSSFLRQQAKEIIERNNL